MILAMPTLAFMVAKISTRHILIRLQKMESDVPTHMPAALLVAHPVQAFLQVGINNDLATSLIPWLQKTTALYLAHRMAPCPAC